MIALRRAHGCVVAVAALAACAQGSQAHGGKPPDAARGSADAPSATIDAAPDAMPDAPTSSACTSAFSGVLATWDFTGQTGSEASVAAASSAPGVTAGSVARSAALTAVSGAGSINSSGWPTTSQRDLTKYYALSVAPPSGCTLSITSLSIDAKSSSTGPASAVAATSVDSFSGTGAVATTMPSTPALAVGNVATTVEIRIYGYSASSTAGTLRLQNMFTVTGSLQ